MAIINNPQAGNAPTVDQQDPNQQNNKNKQRGTGFANIGRILQANQGVGQQIGQKIGGNISEQANAVRQGIEAGRQKFQAGQQTASTAANQNIQAGQRLAKEAGETDEKYAERIAQVQNAGQVGQNLRATQYTGPMGIENADKLQSKAVNTAALSRLAGSGAAGQDLLLRNMVAGRGGYTRGQSALDRLLVGKEGQQAIQAGRQAASGLAGTAQNTLQSAQNLAQATQTDIESGKQTALSGILQGATSIDEAGRQRAQQFKQDAQDLNSVLAGTYKADTPEAKQRALDLISRMGEFGLENKELYSGNVNTDPNMLQSTLSNLAEKISFNYGDKYLSDAQKQAGQVLSQALADKAREEAFKKATFDTDVYKNQLEDEAYRNMDQLAKFDRESQNILKGYGERVKAAEDKIAKQKADRLAAKKQLDQLGQQLQEITGKAFRTDLNSAYYDPNADYGTNQMPTIAGNIGYTKSTRGDITPYTNYELGQYGNIQRGDKMYSSTDIADLINKYNQAKNLYGTSEVNALSYDDKAMNDLVSLGNEASKYGFLAFGDRGDTDQYFDPRFKNLGLVAEQGKGSGDIRSSAQFMSAAQKALGKFTNLKDLLMNRINPAKEAEGINTLNDRTLTQK